MDKHRKAETIRARNRKRMKEAKKQAAIFASLIIVDHPDGKQTYHVYEDHEVAVVAARASVGAVDGLSVKLMRHGCQLVKKVGG